MSKPLPSDGRRNKTLTLRGLKCSGEPCIKGQRLPSETRSRSLTPCKVNNWRMGSCLESIRIQPNGLLAMLAHLELFHDLYDILTFKTRGFLLGLWRVRDKGCGNRCTFTALQPHANIEPTEKPVDAPCEKGNLKSLTLILMLPSLTDNA